MPGALRFQILPEDYLPEPTLIQSPGLIAERPIELSESPELGVRTSTSALALLLEPATGVFRLTDSQDTLLIEGAVEYGEDESPHVRIFRRADERFFGWGGALPGYEITDGKNLSEKVHSRGIGLVPVLLVALPKMDSERHWSERRMVLLYFEGHSAPTVDASKLEELGLLVCWPGDMNEQAAGRIAIDVTFACDSLPKLNRLLAQICGQPASIPRPLLGLGRVLRAGSQVQALSELETARQLPFDYALCQRDYMDQDRVFSLGRGYPEGMGPLSQQLATEKRLLLADIFPSVRIENGYRTFQQGLDKKLFCQTDSGTIFRGSANGHDYAYPDLIDEEALRWWQRCNAELMQAGPHGIRVIQSNLPLPDPSAGLSYADIRHKHGLHSRLATSYPRLCAQAARRASLERNSEIRPAVIVDVPAPAVQAFGSVLLPCDADAAALERGVAQVISLGLSGLHSSGLLVQEAPPLKSLQRKEQFLRRVEATSLHSLFALSAPESEFLAQADNNLQALVAKHVRRRYQLLPYLQSLSYEARTTGQPALVPFSLIYPERRTKENLHHFFVGPHLLVAPIFEASARSAVVSLPEGRWFEFETGRAHTGGGTIELPVEAGYYPLFVRAGAVLPQCRSLTTAGESLDGSLILEIYPDQEISGRVFFEDGLTQNGGHFILKLKGRTRHNGDISVEMTIEDNGYSPPFREVRLRILGPFRYSARGERRMEGQAENLVREDRLIDAFSHVVPLESVQVDFLFSGSGQFS